MKSADDERAPTPTGESKARDFNVVEIALTAAAFIALRQLGALAQIPIWVYLVLLLGSGILSGLVSRRCPTGCSDRRLYVRTAVHVAAITATIYSTGWGPTLAIGYMFTLTDGIRHSGSRVAKPTLVFSMLFIGLGQLAILLGWAPTLVPAPAVHGLGLLAALGLAFAVQNAGVAAAAKEKAEAEVLRSERRFRSLALNASDVVAVVDRQGRLPYVSPAIERLLGRRPAELFDASGSIIHPDDLANSSAAFAEVLEHPGRSLTIELRLQHADGSWRWQESTITNLFGDSSVEGIVANFHDITERKQFEEELARQAYQDRLTGLANRGAFADTLARALARASRENLTTGVLFLDLDRFKIINDSLGHSVGDLMLVDVGERLRSCVRAGDTIARFGGDEFTILAEDISEEDAASMADRIIGVLGERSTIGGRDLSVTASVGVVVSTGGGGADELLRNADLAMYMAKEKGRSRWEMFDSKMGSGILERYRLEEELRHALDDHNMVVHFQPEMALTTSHVVGFEALVRWQHPTRGLLLPGEFISAAEDTGLIVAIDEYVLATACAQLTELNSVRGGQTPLTMNVNVSSASLTSEGAIRLIDIVSRSAVDPGLLQLEITERTAVDGSEVPIDAMKLLRQQGIRLIIDDFGTGYASLAYLQRFPIDGLKIDRSFVSQLGTDKTALAIVRAVVALGQTLGLRLTAEGIETREQLACIRSLGCDGAQGYLLARPLPPEQAVALARQSGALVGVELAELEPARPGEHLTPAPIA